MGKYNKCNESDCYIAKIEERHRELVQGCGKCSARHRLRNCFNCSTPLCNDETKLPQIKCYQLTFNQQPYVTKSKTCHPTFESCYIARDIFWRGKKNWYSYVISLYFPILSNILHF
ncbi:unnamed protein product [Meloidogyne enterolobii]|uniref:Uncharacterized protein n=1 Tax=Meloidogyne enterolobii TaxID=390850 RepID=A0ACB1B3H8_MELEN